MRNTSTCPEVLASLAEILRTQISRLSALGSLDPDYRLMEDLGLDSVEMVGLQVALEDHFGFRFDPLQDDLAEVFRSAGGLSRYVARHLDALERSQAP